MKKIFILVFMLLFTNCYALENDINNDSLETVKYYKTTTYYINNQVEFMSDAYNRSVTEEISEEEYNNANVDNGNMRRSSTPVETTYKRLSVKIYARSNRYRYEANLHWKNMPAKRYYDIIGIGFPSSVKLINVPYIENKYTGSNGVLYTSTVKSYEYTGNHGVGITFPLPVGTISTMDVMMHFDIEKNTTATINTLYAYSDYSHATKNISLNNAKKYIVDCGGIELENSVYSYFDDINTADYTLSVNW